MHYWASNKALAEQQDSMVKSKSNTDHTAKEAERIDVACMGASFDSWPVTPL